MSEATLPAWLTEAEESMKSQPEFDGEFKDIERGRYVLAITGYDSLKPDKNDDLRCNLEFTINGDGLTERTQETISGFDGRKIWPGVALDGQYSEKPTQHLIVAWIKRNPDKAAYLGAQPDNVQAWGEYLDACVAGELTVIASVAPRKKTERDVKSREVVDGKEVITYYPTKYNIYVSADQTADQPQEGTPAI